MDWTVLVSNILLIVFGLGAVVLFTIGKNYWLVLFAIFVFGTALVFVDTYGIHHRAAIQQKTDRCHAAGGHYWDDRNVCVRYIYPGGK